MHTYVRTVCLPHLPTDLKPMMAIRRVLGGIFVSGQTAAVEEVKPVMKGGVSLLKPFGQDDRTAYKLVGFRGVWSALQPVGGAAQWVHISVPEDLGFDCCGCRSSC